MKNLDKKEVELFIILSIFYRRPSNTCVFLSCRSFVVNTTFSTGLVSVEVSSVSRLGHLTEFKSLIIVIVGFQNFVCYLVWAVCLSWSSNY